MTDTASSTTAGEEREADSPESAQARVWRVARASVQGTSHARTGQPCQDSSGVGEGAPEGMLIAAVADGAGSAALSADGSRIAARAATQEAVRLMRLHVQPVYEGVLQDTLRQAVRYARDEVEAEAQRQGKSIRDFATTLILAVCSPKITGAAQIGDGAMIAAGEGASEGGENSYELLCAPQRGEYANATNFITAANWQDILDIETRRGGVSRVAMFSDGIQSIALNAAAGNAPHAPFFDPLFRWADGQADADAAGQSLAAFLSSPRVTARADDDLTLLLAVR